MTIRVNGPMADEDDLSGMCPTTSGEALKLYADRHDIRLTPYDGSWDSLPSESKSEPKYFFFNDGGRFGDILVDIHVERGGEDICPKQDLEFPLLDGDIINIGALAC